MSEEEVDEEPSLAEIAEIIRANVRPWNSYWALRDKTVGEHGAAYAILEAAGVNAEGLVSRQQGHDPPDCEATLDGCLTGIEVTELVHQPTLERSLKAMKQRAGGKEPDPKKSEAFFVWEREDLLLALQDRIDAKDQSELKGGPYERYILVIHTDEMFLEADKVEQWLRQATFKARRITDVLSGLSHHPGHGGCPVFNGGVSSCHLKDTPH
jgi:hypothetical protein